ncbi:TetR family transcriptional regulator [Rudaeicoccus suwonensis]|uniref:TetR family transcriptional regulator n=1 Tax=Rudaeicoccus suwonensis TaxID=657409 RepID=A0A561E3M2_9MICO|nr:TetR/AcrR family transcriptional regulator [Rudaeicoccus suwonensis]TWE10213.1 TetR family transcriptional regulator [Rudaeicoccus suwonensis]
MTPGTSTRTALKQTAIRLFVSKGYDGTSISDLTGELDITKAAFYHHFNSKIDLLLQIVDPVIRRTTELLETTPEELPDPNDRWKLLERAGEVGADEADAMLMLSTDMTLWQHIPWRVEARTNYDELVLRVAGPRPTPDALARSHVAMFTAFRAAAALVTKGEWPVASECAVTDHAAFMKTLREMWWPSEPAEGAPAPA